MEEASYLTCPLCESTTADGDYCSSCNRWNKIIDEKSEGRLPSFLKPGPLKDEFAGARDWAGPWTKAGIIAFFVLLFLKAITELDKSGAIPVNYVTVCAALAGWTSIVFFFNRTRIRFSPDRLDVSRGPLYVPLAESFNLYKSAIKTFHLIRIRGRKSGLSYKLRIEKHDRDSYDVLEMKDENEACAFYAYMVKWLGVDLKYMPISEEQVLEEASSPQAKISSAYIFTLAGLFMANIAVTTSLKESDYILDRYTFASYGQIFSVVFAVMFFHHRKHLSVWTSRPLKPDEKKGKPLVYLVISAVFSLMMFGFIFLLGKGLRSLF